MSAKTKQPIPDQTPLFEGFDFNPGEYAVPTPFVPWNEFGDAKRVAQVTSRERGPSVDVESRDEALINVVDNLSRVSMLNGLQNAIRSPRRTEIQSRYGKDYHDLVDNSVDAIRAGEVAARSEFSSAFGYRQLAEKIGGLATSEMFVDVYDKFQDRYWGPKGNKSRNDLKKQITRRQNARHDSGFTKQAIRGFMHQDPA